MELSQRIFAGAVSVRLAKHGENTRKNFRPVSRAVASDDSCVRCASAARGVKFERTIFPPVASETQNIFSRDLRSSKENNSRQFPGSLPMPSRASSGAARDAL